MIKILITREENNFKELEVKGHANSAPHGHDLVCAAVSAVVTGGFNALLDTTNFEIKLDEGYAYLKAKDKISSHDEAVVDTIITQLQTIESVDKEFIKIKNL